MFVFIPRLSHMHKHVSPLCPCTHTLFPASFSSLASSLTRSLSLLILAPPIPSPFLTLPSSAPLSSHFLHHDPLLYLFMPVLLSLPLLGSPSTQSLILCFLILPRETPDIRFIRPFLVSEYPPRSLSTFFFHFLSWGARAWQE